MKLGYLGHPWSGGHPFAATWYDRTGSSEKWGKMMDTGWVDTVITRSYMTVVDWRAVWHSMANEGYPRIQNNWPNQGPMSAMSGCQGAWLTPVKCLSIGYEQVCTENHWDALSYWVDLLWKLISDVLKVTFSFWTVLCQKFLHSFGQMHRNHVTWNLQICKKHCFLPCFLQSTDWRSPFGFEHLHAPQPRCGEDQSFEPSGAEGGEHGKTLKACWILIPRLERMAHWLTFPDTVRSPRCRANRSRIFRGGAAAMLLRRAACGDAHGLQKRLRIWYIMIYLCGRPLRTERFPNWGMFGVSWIIQFLGYPNFEWPNGPKFLSMSKCLRKFGKIHTTAAGCLLASLQCAITLATERNLVLSKWSHAKMAWIGGWFLVWNHPSLLVKVYPKILTSPKVMIVLPFWICLCVLTCY